MSRVSEWESKRVWECDAGMGTGQNVKCQMWNAYVDTWDILNNFCFHVYAQKSVFIDENDKFFLTWSPSPVSGPIIEMVPSLKMSERQTKAGNLEAF